MIKVYKFIVNVLFVITIIFLLVYFMLRVTDKVEIYKVKTGSMEEKIHVGDYILIYQKDSYNVGEIVTYTSNDGFITHRIIRKENGMVITKGDANNAEDKEILESTIVGKVIISGGVLNTIINYKYVFICILLSLYLFSCYFDNGKKLNQGDQEANELINADNGVLKDNSVEGNKLQAEEVTTKIDKDNKEKEKEEKKEVEKVENKSEKQDDENKPVKDDQTDKKDTETKEVEKKTETKKAKSEKKENEKK